MEPRLREVAARGDGASHRRAPYLKTWMAEHGQMAHRVAAAIGLDKQRMYRRLRGDTWFSLAQARAIARYLRVPYSEVFPADDGVDPRDLVAQRVAEAGPERRHAS